LGKQKAAIRKAESRKQKVEIEQTKQKAESSHKKSRE
jgi:hypothetical protein